MTIRGIGRIAVLAAIALAPAASVPAVAQNKAWTAPRTPDGKPDLQGIWSYATITPVERPAEFAGKEFLSEQEAAAYEKRLLQENNRDRRDGTAQEDVTRVQRVLVGSRNQSRLHAAHVARRGPSGWPHPAADR